MSKFKNSKKILGPTYTDLQFWGLMLKEKRRMYNVVHFCAIIFVITQYVELWIIRKDFEMAMRNLSVTMLSTVCVYKARTFVFWEESWMEIIEYVTDLEKKQLSKKDSMTNIIIADYSAYSRKVTYLYRILIVATVLLVIFSPMFNIVTSVWDYQNINTNGSVIYSEVLSSWVPFDKTKGFGYWITALEHSLICIYGGSIVANFDCNAVVLLSFFAGQLKILSGNCARLFESHNNQSVDNNEMIKERIRECHYHHLYIIKYTSVLNSLMSPVMFLYVIICSLMICASAIQLTMESTSNMQRIWIAEYLMALIAQLFLYCWHSNEVLHMSNQADAGVYESTWYRQNVDTRRSLLLLGGQLRKTIELSAGPFTKLNIAAFVAILKGSYSYYTLLDKKEN